MKITEFGQVLIVENKKMIHCLITTIPAYPDETSFLIGKMTSVQYTCTVQRTSSRSDHLLPIVKRHLFINIFRD